MDLVYGICLRSTRRPAVAEELAQDTFLRAYRALGRYLPERIAGLKTRSWLVTIALNVCRNAARAAGPSVLHLDGAALTVPTDPSEDPAAVIERREAAARWARALDALPAAHRLPVELRHVHGLSYPEMAAALHRPLGTVKAQVHRGTAQLRAAYRALHDDEDTRARLEATA